jgi:hypothetical protein
VSAEELGHAGFASPAFGHVSHELLQSILAGIDLYAVEHQEDEGGHGAGSLVPIDEGMILSDVEQVGRAIS